MVQRGVKLGLAGLAATLLLGVPVEPRAAVQTLQIANDLCAAATKKAEQEAKIPRHLLTAISLAESGRWDERIRASFAWPWTVTAGGSSMYFPTKDEAIGAVRELQAKGRTNIDVGCMQINLHYHPNAFETIEDAFDPTTNTGYAARFLSGLYKETESWAEAAGKYHSSDPARNGSYRNKVFALYEKVSGRQHTELGRIEERWGTAPVEKLRPAVWAAERVKFGGHRPGPGIAEADWTAVRDWIRGLTED